MSIYTIAVSKNGDPLRSWCVVCSAGVDPEDVLVQADGSEEQIAWSEELDDSDMEERLFGVLDQLEVDYSQSHRPGSSLYSEMETARCLRDLVAGGLSRVAAVAEVARRIRQLLNEGQPLEEARLMVRWSRWG